jgi:Kdo2-lipid IVA lauroyltransferase/acyltransferase
MPNSGVGSKQSSIKTQRKKIERRAGYIAFSVFEKAFLKKTPEDAERAGEKLGALVFRISKKRRTTALRNLALAMPELSEDRRIELAKQCFLHFGRIFADFLRASAKTNAEVLKITESTGFENLDQALSLGKGAIIISGHFGHWERGAHLVAARGYKLTVIARDANDGDLNQAVMRIREMQGVSVLSRGQAARGIFATLKRNETVCILADQNSSDIFIPFFGVPCGTVTGPSAIHVKTGAPMVPVFAPRVGPGKYEVRILPALQAVEGYEPVEGITRAINNCLETQIREHPEQWLWFHDRWKSTRKAGLL